MGKSQRDKGYRTENNVRLKALEHGLDAYRVPLSGGASIKGDIMMKNSVDEWVLEIKCRGTASNKSLMAEDNDALVLKADNKPELVVLPMADFF